MFQPCKVPQVRRPSLRPPGDGQAWAGGGPKTGWYPADRPRLRRRLALLWAAVLLFSGLGPRGYVADGTAVGLVLCFFSPETNINNFSTLKGEFDGYFADNGGCKFQPFSNRETFEQFLASPRNRLFLMSGWHFRQLRDRTDLDPVMVGTLQSRTTQRRLLVARREAASPESLRGAKVATAGSREYTLTLLTEMLGAERQDLIASFQILVVPKDIDALMSIGYGLAQAAVTTEGGLEKLQKINPRQAGLLQPLITGKEASYPIIVAPKKRGLEIEEMFSVLNRMGADAEGRQRLRLLGLDGWRPIAEDEKEQWK